MPSAICLAAPRGRIHLDAILDPMSANTALVPYDLLLGAASALFAVLGTAVNLAELFS